MKWAVRISIALSVLCLTTIFVLGLHSINDFLDMGVN